MTSPSNNQNVLLLFSLVPTGTRRIVRILGMHITQYNACTKKVTGDIGECTCFRKWW